MDALHFAPQVPPWMLLIGALALGVAGWLYYRGRDEGLDTRRRALLRALRLAGFAVAIFALAGPTIRSTETLRRARPLAVLIDSSASMGEKDSGADGKSSRLEAERESFRSAAARLARAYDLRVYSFDGRANFLGDFAAEGDKAIAAAKGLDASGKSTALGDALVEAAPRETGSAVLVLSDGASNAGRPPFDAAGVLAARGVKVFAAPFGQAGRPNVAVKRVLGPRLLLAGEPAAFFAEVAFTGDVTGPARLTLRQGDKVVARTDVAPSAAPALARLNFAPEGEGDITYTIEAEALPGEGDTADNAARRTVRVAREKLKVLYVEELPRWEYRFIKNAILRDERLAPKLLLRTADKEVAAQPEYTASFPRSRADLFKFDVIVIGDVDPGFFLPGDIDNLRAFVSEGGGGLLFVAGANFNPSRYGGSGLGELCPADFVGAETPAGDGAAIALTDAGASNAALTLSGQEQKAFWKALPKVGWYAKTKLRAGATALAESAPGGAPLIVEEPFGRGRTMLVATDELWRWRKESGDRYLYRLWAQLVRYLGARRLSVGAAAGEVALSADEYAQGEEVEATAYLENGLGMPVDDPSVEGFVEDAAGRRTPVAFSRAAEAKGLYRAEFPAGGAGKYTLYARGANGFVAVPYTVSGDSVETLSRQADVRALETVAAATGGRLIAPDKLLDVLGFFPAEAESVSRVTSRPLWASYWFFVPLVAFFSCEWYFRKRWGLM